MSWAWKRRPLIQGAFLAAFILLSAQTRQTDRPQWLANLPMRLDPLLVLARSLTGRGLAPWGGLALLTLGLTLALGRVWCGWMCPLGTIIEWTQLRPDNDPGSLPGAWWRARHVALIAIVAAALLGSLSLLVLDPLTLLSRALAAGVWPALDQVITQVEQILYRLPLLRPAVLWADGRLRPHWLPQQPAFYHLGWVHVALLGAVLALNTLAVRFWCRALCPLGSLLGLASRIPLFRRRVSAACSSCGLCSRICPTQAITARNGFASDPGECLACGECVATCPQAAIEFAWQPPARMTWGEYSPGRRQALLAIGVTVGGVALLRRDASIAHSSATWIRPPGAERDAMLTRCIRCGQCIHACPTHGLQPAWSEAGVEGLCTPILVPQIGYCDYSCYTCGQTCPVGAIPALSLEEKRTQVIGLAYVDKNHCIPWADGKPCIVCEEMCPVPDKAIRLEEVEVQDAQGQAAWVQRPHVIRDLCIGCGICEFKCPAQGGPAIRVSAL